MSRFTLLAALLAAGSLAPSDAVPARDAPRTSAPVGPGNPARSWYTTYQPLPRPASQAKRRRKARRQGWRRG